MIDDLLNGYSEILRRRDIIYNILTECGWTDKLSRLSPEVRWDYIGDIANNNDLFLKIEHYSNIDHICINIWDESNELIYHERYPKWMFELCDVSKDTIVKFVDNVKASKDEKTNSLQKDAEIHKLIELAEKYPDEFNKIKSTKETTN